MAEEDKFLLATNGDESNSGDNGNRSNGADDAQMDNKVLSAVAHYVMVHYAEKEMLKSKRRDTNPKLGNKHWTPDLGSLGAKV
jgi:hypothetical protein